MIEFQCIDCKLVQPMDDFCDKCQGTDFRAVEIKECSDEDCASSFHVKGTDKHAEVF